MRLFLTTRHIRFDTVGVKLWHANTNRSCAFLQIHVPWALYYNRLYKRRICAYLNSNLCLYFMICRRMDVLFVRMDTIPQRYIILCCMFIHITYTYSKMCIHVPRSATSSRQHPRSLRLCDYAPTGMRSRSIRLLRVSCACAVFGSCA